VLLFRHHLFSFRFKQLLHRSCMSSSESLQRLFGRASRPRYGACAWPLACRRPLAAAAFRRLLVRPDTAARPARPGCRRSTGLRQRLRCRPLRGRTGVRAAACTAQGCKQLPACGRCCCRLTRTRLTRWTRQTHGSGATTLSRAAHVRAARPAPSATCAAPAG